MNRFLVFVMRVLPMIFLLMPTPGQAQKKEPVGEGLLNKLLSPGPLVQSHEDLGHKDCLQCHEPAGGVPNKLCLDCHKEVKKHVETRTHFHGKGDRLTKTCHECHVDHKGRAHNTAPFDMDAFDHDVTEFKLTGAHIKTECKDCHTGKRPGNRQPKFFGQSQSCKSCHAKDDVHSFTDPKLKAKECSSCHTTKDWKDLTIKFDHFKETGYALVGSHAKIKCHECHAPDGPKSARYDWPNLKTQKCLSCHEDQHRDNLSPRFRGGSCDKCHNQDVWELPNFKHSVTTFELGGAHAKTECVSCHKQTSEKKKLGDFRFQGLKKACNSCHADYHGYVKETNDKLGKLSECQTCHNDVSWKPYLRFDHDKDTRFPVDGEHKKNKCFECHISLQPPKPNVARKYHFAQLPTKTCETCHKDPHPQTFHQRFKGAKCADCHNAEGWNIISGTTIGGKGGKNFHDRTRFPLTGDHTRVKCIECHKINGKELYKFPNADKKFCVNCHSNVHKNQFERGAEVDACGTCHNTTDFRNLLTFDHDKTDFRLTGSHEKIGKKCVECHTPTQEKLATEPPKTAHKFIFAGKERGFCENCHKNVHEGQFDPKGTKKPCGECHNTDKFANLKTFNHDTTDFKITGEHVKFEKKCVKCHVPTDKKLATTPPKTAHLFRFAAADRGFCEACHKSVHKQQFHPQTAGRACSECHNTTTFKKILTFEHDKTHFKLTGAHAKVGDCKKCHTPSNILLPTVPPKKGNKYVFQFHEEGFCESCHKNEHQDMFHKEFSDKPCATCHTTDVFTKRKDFNHDQTDYKLKGKHLEVKCEECHKNTPKRFEYKPQNFKGKYLFPEIPAKDCATCHKDPHKGSRGPKCSSCHNEDGWGKAGDFHKHNTLEGVHLFLGCRDCHDDNRRLLRGAGNECETCHNKDDPHNGALVPCQECHSQSTWFAAKFNHNMTLFPLQGAHRLTDCNSCHNRGVYQGTPTDCQSCHFTDAAKVTVPDHSDPRYSNCGQCHNQFDF